MTNYGLDGNAKSYKQTAWGTWVVDQANCPTIPQLIRCRIQWFDVHFKRELFTFSTFGKHFLISRQVLVNLLLRGMSPLLLWSTPPCDRWRVYWTWSQLHGMIEFDSGVRNTQISRSVYSSHWTDGPTYQQNAWFCLQNHIRLPQVSLREVLPITH